MNLGSGLYIIFFTNNEYMRLTPDPRPSAPQAMAQSPACVDVSDTGNPPVTTITNGTNTCFNSPGYPATILPRRRCAWRFQVSRGAENVNGQQ